MDEPVKNSFTTTLVEKIMSIVIFPVCYLYASILFDNLVFSVDSINQFDVGYILFGIFVLLFLIMGEIFYWDRKRTWESIAMMVMTVIGAVSVCFGIGAVWNYEATMFFTHLFGVYWILCRSGRLAEGETSHMFVWDGITGFCVMPFKNWPLNVRTIITIFKRNREKKRNHITILIVLAASLIGILLFFIAMSHLRNADTAFDGLMGDIAAFFRFDLDFDVIPKLFLTVLVGTYLYGLFGGCYRETEEQVRHRGDNLKRFLNKLHKVPDLVWILFIGLFSVFYIIFFAFQGNYLFSAFIMKLPQEFTYSEYARSGFGDMCGVMGVNFIMLWLAARTSVNNRKATKIACAVLDLESMVLALIAFLKIAMYINAYGFTPLRFQSIWAATVLFFACVCVMISMLTGKKTVKVWFYVSAASLAALCLI